MLQAPYKLVLVVAQAFEWRLGLEQLSDPGCLPSAGGSQVPTNRSEEIIHQFEVIIYVGSTYLGYHSD